MKKSKFTEAQIAFILKQAEEGTPVAEVCRKAGISDATFYGWRKKYAGLMPSEMKRLRVLEEENGKLKKLVADLSLDKAMLQDVLSRICMVRSVRARSLNGGNESSLPKCIRPLASGLRLQPGQDEIRAHRSWINCPCMSTLSAERFTARRSTVSSSRSRTSQSADGKPYTNAGSRR